LWFIGKAAEEELFPYLKHQLLRSSIEDTKKLKYVVGDIL